MGVKAPTVWLKNMVVLSVITDRTIELFDRSCRGGAVTL